MSNKYLPYSCPSSSHIIFYFTSYFSVCACSLSHMKFDLIMLQAHQDFSKVICMLIIIISKCLSDLSSQSFVGMCKVLLMLDHCMNIFTIQSIMLFISNQNQPQQHQESSLPQLHNTCIPYQLCIYSTRLYDSSCIIYSSPIYSYIDLYVITNIKGINRDKVKVRFLGERYLLKS